MKLLLYIPPTGFFGELSPEIILLPEEDTVNLRSYTRGEGQALLFELSDYDVSKIFGQRAIEEGKLVEHFGNRRFPVTITVPDDNTQISILREVK